MVEMLHLDRLEAHFSWVDRHALGYSIIPHTHEVATMAFVSFIRIQQLSASTSVGVEDLLGLAVAHEIGHLLFGTNEHANYGLMRAQWRLRDLEAKAWNEFEFTKDQVKRLRAAILVRMTSEEQANAQRPMINLRKLPAIDVLFPGLCGSIT
jgi:hypothetical protein